MQHKKIAFIGAGNMAFAIISGLVRHGYPADKILAVNKSNLARREQLISLGVGVELNANLAVEQADIVLLAVKPQMMAEVCLALSADLSDKLVISVAAGISVARLSELLPTASQIVRAMPNTPALIGEGVTGLFAKEGLNPTACHQVEHIFASVGRSYWLDSEQKLNHIIAVTGSSPAYFFRFMEMMQQTALQMGFEEKQARELIQATALGAVKMAQQNESLSLAALRENVTSKGGTTAEALAVFEQYQLAEMVEKAMWAAVHRAEEMEKSL